MSSPTIKDVAKLAGVSISTVSRVMNDSKPVSPEARRKVLDAINKLDFKPNELARSLVMKKSNIIGVITKDIGIPYMAQIIRGIEEIGRMYKYDILLTSTYDSLESELNAVEFLATKQVEGIILLSEDISAEVVVKIKDHKIPYVHLDKYYNPENFPTVTIDYREASGKMVDYLVGLGHQNILFAGAYGTYAMDRAKAEGYKKAMLAQGLEPLLIESPGLNPDAGYEIGDIIQKQRDEKGVTAIFCSDDELAIGFINYCYDKNIGVPSEISVAGFGDDFIAKVYRPRLTTVQEPYYDIGAIAMRTMTKRLKDSEILRETIYMPVQIMERESTARCQVSLPK